MSNILESYLVSLGFETDAPSLRKFEDVLERAHRSVTDHATGISKTILEAQGIITGGFLSVSAGIVGLVDKVAMQDQAWRLLGERYLMTAESARKMDLVTKTLGATLEQTFWDPELRERAGLLLGDIDRWEHALGPGFEQKMKQIRDLRFEFQRLGVAGQFLTMSFTEKLFDKLGMGDIFTKVHDFVDNLDPQKIARFADILADHAVPVLKETWQIILDITDVLKEAGVAFTNFVGLLSGDQSIQGTAFSFQNLLVAIDHVEHGFSKFLHYVTEAEQLLAHFASAVSLLFSGKFDQAKNEFMAGIQQLTAGSGGVLGAAIGGIASGPLGAALGAGIGTALGKLNSKYGAAATDSNTGAGTTDSNTALNIDEQIERSAPTPRVLPNVPEVPVTSEAVFDLNLPAALTKKSRQLPHWLQWGGPSQSTLDASRTHVFEWLSDAASLLKRVPEASRKGVWPWQIPAKQTSPAASSPPEGNVIDLIRQAADKYNVPRELALAVAEHESGFNPKATHLNKNKTTDYGLFQLNSSNLKTWGVTDPFDVAQNTDAGVRHLAELLKRYGGHEAPAIAAYNAGESQVDTRTLTDLPDSVQKYVSDVFALEQKYTDRNAVIPGRDMPASAIAERLQKSDSAPVPDAVNSLQRVIASSDLALTTSGNISLAGNLTLTTSGDITLAGGRYSYPEPEARAQAREYFERPAMPSAPGNASKHDIRYDVGGITIQIMQPGADAYEIERRTENAIRRALQGQTQFDLANTVPQW